jgi:hypothetical protein
MDSGYTIPQARSTRTLSNSVTYQRRPKVSQPVMYEMMLGYLI